VTAAPAGSAVPRRPPAPLTPLVRFLLWDYDRGSLPFDLACLLVFLLLLLVPPGWWGDPLWSSR
jgi:hypothetical protein